MVKKVGIITYHGSHNYGSVLQSYALQTALENYGYTTQIINLRTNEQREMYKIISKKNNWKYNFIRFLFYIDNKVKYNKFENFISNTLNVTEDEFNTSSQLKANAPLFDAYITGSDQVWNMNVPHFDDVYFLTFTPQDSKKIAYAPSFGTTFFSEEVRTKLAKLIGSIDFLSVREEEGATLINELCNREAKVVADPTLLLTSEDWSKIAVKPKYRRPYILCYFLENNNGDRSYIESLQRKTGYDVVILNDYIRDVIKGYKRQFNAGPLDFVGLFKNASFIYTNSFHGTVFSTIFEKPFLTAVGNKENRTVNNTDSRKLNFLASIGLLDRAIQGGSTLSEGLLNIDYTFARKQISLLREDSLSYLINSLK